MPIWFLYWNLCDEHYRITYPSLQALQADIITMEPNVLRLEPMLNQLLSENNTDPTFANQLKNRHEVLIKEWKRICSDALNFNGSLEGAMEKNRQVS